MVQSGGTTIPPRARLMSLVVGSMTTNDGSATRGGVPVGSNCITAGVGSVAMSGVQAAARLALKGSSASLSHARRSKVTRMTGVDIKAWW